MDFKLAAKKYGINHIGVSDADIYNNLSGENAGSVLVALFPYFVKTSVKSNLSKYCRSGDYHRICTHIMQKICTDCGFENFKVFCDTGFPIDRRLAYNAGLGFYGLNSMLINDELGSYFFIAYAVLNEKLKAGTPLSKTCLMCKKCIKACPGGAICNGKIDASRCISSITQKKGILTDEEKALMKKCGLVFGCDICQDICPHNKNVSKTPVSEFLSDRLENLELCHIEGLSNREFKEKFGRYAFSWRGKEVLKRNLNIMEEK